MQVGSDQETFKPDIITLVITGIVKLQVNLLLRDIFGKIIDQVGVLVFGQYCPWFVQIHSGKTGIIANVPLMF